MENLSLGDLAQAAWKRRWWFIVPVALGLAGAFAAIRMLPPVYRASTTVMVEPQKVPADYVKSTVTTDLQDRLKTIEQQITNRSNLERVIREVGLYPELRAQYPIDVLVDRLRNDLAVDTKGGSVFQVFFKGTNPEKVASTANRLAELFIQANLQLREDQAQGTSSFLEAELKETKGKLEAQEAKIATFKRLYMGQLPEQRDTNLQSMQQLQAKLQINLDALDKAEVRKLYVQAQLAESRNRETPAGPLAPPPGPSRLQVAQSELAALRAQYTDRHPEVIRKRAEIAELQREPEPAPVAAPSAPAAPREDPVLRSELRGVELEIRNLQAEQGRIQAAIGSYQARLEGIPGVEQGLLSLTRDYDNLQRSYESLLNKRIEARLAENLEKRNQGEQFTILEKALPPEEPYWPNKPLLLAIGLMAGAAVGIGLAIVREHTDQTYGDLESLHEDFPGVPVLATIPILKNPGARIYASAARERRRR